MRWCIEGSTRPAVAAAWHACADITIITGAICISSGGMILTCRHINTTLLLNATLQPSPFPSHCERTGSYSTLGQCPPPPPPLPRWAAPDCAARASPLTWTPTPWVRPAHLPPAEPEPGEETEGPAGGGWPKGGWGSSSEVEWRRIGSNWHASSYTVGTLYGYYSM